MKKPSNQQVVNVIERQAERRGMDEMLALMGQYAEDLRKKNLKREAKAITTMVTLFRREFNLVHDTPRNGHNGKSSIILAG